MEVIKIIQFSILILNVWPQITKVKAVPYGDAPLCYYQIHHSWEARPASHHALAQHCSEVPLVSVPRDSHAARASCHFVVILPIYGQNSAWVITLPFPLIEVASVCPLLITGPSQSPLPVHPHQVSRWGLAFKTHVTSSPLLLSSHLIINHLLHSCSQKKDLFMSYDLSVSDATLLTLSTP